jgi:cytochrome c-type biogenesis protein CcmE
VKAGTIADAGAADRFVVAQSPDGTGKTVAVSFSGALPSGMKDGSQVVIAGELDAAGKFTATSVALEQSQK